MVRIDYFLDSIRLTIDMDQVNWKLTAHGNFIVNSLYKYLGSDELHVNTYNSIWQA
jgi:hypothetical protein